MVARPDRTADDAADRGGRHQAIESSLVAAYRVLEDSITRQGGTCGSDAVVRTARDVLSALQEVAPSCPGIKEPVRAAERLLGIDSLERDKYFQAAGIILFATDALGELLPIPHVAQTPESQALLDSACTALAAAITDCIRTVGQIYDADRIDMILKGDNYTLAFSTLTERFNSLKWKLAHLLSRERGQDLELRILDCSRMIIDAAHEKLKSFPQHLCFGLDFADTKAAVRLPEGDQIGVFRGEMYTISSQQNVAVKFLPRVRDGVDIDKLKRHIYDRCQVQEHPRIARVLGVGETRALDRRLALVTTYAENGDILQYLGSHESADRLSLAIQILEGLQFLHNDAGFAHGNLKCENVLVSASGEAMLTDYRWTEGYPEADLPFRDQMMGFKNIRNLAPELLFGGGKRSPASDVYAFGVVLYQVYRSERPWADKSTMDMIQVKQASTLPGRPRSASMDDNIWQMCIRCWEPDPTARPHVDQLLDELRGNQGV